MSEDPGRGVEDEQPNPRTIRVKGIASDVILDREAGVAVKMYRRQPLIEALYRVAFQSTFPYVDNIAALKAAKYRRRIASLITQYFLGRDVIAPVVGVERREGRYAFVTELVRGGEPNDHSKARSFLHEVTDAFIAAGLPTWQVTPYNPRSLGNLMETEDGDYVVVDLESNVVTPMIPLSAAWRSAREAHLPPFDDIDLARLFRFIDHNSGEIEQRLGTDGARELRLAAGKYAWYERLWHGEEPRLWSRTLRGITRFLDLPAHFRSLGRRVSGLSTNAGVAQGWLHEGISRWVGEGRLTQEQAATARGDLESGQTISVLVHLGAHITMSVPLRFPLGSAARFLWTAFFRTRAELRALIHRHADEETRNAREIHAVPVMLAAAVPGAGAAAYVLAAPLRRNRVLMAVAVDEAFRMLPLKVHGRLHLDAVTAGMARSGTAGDDVPLARLGAAAASGVRPLLRQGALVWSVIAVSVAAMLAGVAYYAATGNDGAFAEFGLVSTLKVAGAYAVAALGISYFRRFWECPGEPGLEAEGTLFWPVAGLALLWITLDDYLQIHEAFADLLPDWSLVPLADQLTFVGYLLLGVALARFFRRELVASTSVTTLIVAGIVLASLALLGDAVISDDSPWSAIEEAAHLAAVTAFLCAFIIRYRELGPYPAPIAVLPLVRTAARTGFTPSFRNVVHWASWVTALAVFLALTVVLLPGQVYGWEVDFTRWVQDINYPDWAFKITADRLTNSDTEEGVTIILGVAALLFVLRLPVEAFLVMLMVPLHVLANFPKAFMDRERPSALIEGLAGFGGLKSFPSGHAEFAIVFYGFLTYLAIMHVHHRALRVAFLAAWIGMAMVVGYARLSVGKHWPLDIIAGYAIGFGILSGLIWLHTHLTRASDDLANGEAAKVEANAVVISRASVDPRVTTTATE